jgi:hypothetical protein
MFGFYAEGPGAVGDGAVEVPLFVSMFTPLKPVSYGNP